MNNTTHLPQNIHQNAKNAPNKAHLNKRTKKKYNSNENRTVAKLQKAIDRKAEKQKEARSGASAICFVAVNSERRNDGAGQRSNCANIQLMVVGGAERRQLTIIAVLAKVLRCH